MRYGLVGELRLTLHHLESELSALCAQLRALRLLTARVFVLPPVLKGDENKPLTHIETSQLLNRQALDKALAHFSQLFMQHRADNISTKSAVRLPGILCFSCNETQRLELVQRIALIGQLKQRLKTMITEETGLPSEERFEFVHQHFPGLLTLNVWRTITLLEKPDSVRFGWANKHVIRNVSHREIADKLEKSLKSGRSRAPWSREQWAEKVQQELALIRALPAQARLKIKRPVKVQPIARVWYAGTQQQVQLACPSPLLMTCSDSSQLPVTGGLLSYNAEAITHRYRPDAEQLHLLIPRLHLYSDRV